MGRLLHPSPQLDVLRAGTCYIKLFMFNVSIDDVAAIGEATAQAYNKQQEAIGEEAIKQIKIVELIAAAIENGKIKIVPDVLVTGGGAAGDGLMGQLTRLLPGMDLNALVKKQPAAPEVKV